MTEKLDDVPNIKGKIIRGAELAPYTWFRVGGPADVLALPADVDDLIHFLSDLNGSRPVTCLGVGSNTIVRDGGVEGVVIRLAGRNWGAVERVGELDLKVGAGALDLSVARAAASAGISGLSFLSGIPGAMGGAVRTNAGCYGSELRDRLVKLEGVTHTGEQVAFQCEGENLGLPQVRFSYRHTDLPENIIVTSLTLRGTGTAPQEVLMQEISEHQSRRAETQPIREKTGGSTFANPDPPGSPGGRSSWKLIDEAGCRGLRVGGAQVSEKHCNFLINVDKATASDIEALGELVRARVREITGVDLRWEIRRVGRLMKVKSAPS